MGQMKILLTEDVLDLGQAGEVHVVAGGYARNYLMPRGLAILASKGALKQAEEIRQAGMRRRARERSSAEAQAELISGRKLLFTARAGENDRLYGSVTSTDIADRLAEEVGFEIDRRQIALGQAIRDLGIYELTLRLMQDVDAMFEVAVVREEETWEDAEARAAEHEAALQAAEEAAAAAAAEVEKAAAEAEAEADEETAEEEASE